MLGRRIFVAVLALAGLGSFCDQQPAEASKTAASSTELAAPPPPRALETEMELVRRSFRLRKVTLRVVDMHMSTDLAKTIRGTESAVFALNGGFFDGRGDPIGLALSKGRVLSPPLKRPGGVLLIHDDLGGSLHDAETFELPEEHEGFGIQALPRLVVGGEVNIRRDDGKRAERVALCLDRGGHTLDVVFVRDKDVLGPTLFELAQWLAAHDCPEALNLDGGPSAGIAWRREDQIHEIAPRGPIRHAIVIHTNDGATEPP